MTNTQDSLETILLLIKKEIDWIANGCQGSPPFTDDASKRLVRYASLYIDAVRAEIASQPDQSLDLAGTPDEQIKQLEQALSILKSTSQPQR